MQNKIIFEIKIHLTAYYLDFIDSNSNLKKDIELFAYFHDLGIYLNCLDMNELGSIVNRAEGCYGKL